MVSGTCRSGVSQLSSENGMERGVKWMGDLACSGEGTCCCGKSEAAAETSNPAIAMESARRTANPLPNSMHCIFFAEPFNFTLLSGGVPRTLRGSVGTIQVPADPRFLRQGVLGNLQLSNSGQGISFRNQTFAKDHVRRAILRFH